MDVIRNLFEADGVRILISLETSSQVEHSAYYPSNILFYIVEGKLGIKSNQQTQLLGPGTMVLVRKYTNGKYFKTWEPHEKGAKVYVIGLQNAFITAAIGKTTSGPSKADAQNTILLDQHSPFKQSLENIISYVENNQQVDKNKVLRQIKAAIASIVDFQPELLPVLASFAVPERADLVSFMQHNYRINVKLEELAQLSGRSLSTFNREFRKLFNDSPHQWILRKRLQEARDLLITTSLTPSQIYLDLGFEDLAHFSRAFKRLFGKTPTEIKHSKH